MSEFFKAELKDRFLEYAADRSDYFEVQLLYDEFLRPNYSLEYAQKLIQEILDHDLDLLDVMSGNGMRILMVSSTAYTDDFLEEGGFTDLFIKEEEKWDSFLGHLTYNPKRSSAEDNILKNSVGQERLKKERGMLFLLIGAVAISFLFTLFSLLRNTFFSEEYATKAELQDALREMEKLEQENQKLKEKIATYDEQHSESDSLMAVEGSFKDFE